MKSKDLKRRFKRSWLGRLLRQIAIDLERDRRAREQWKREDPLSYYQYQDRLSYD